MRRSRKALIALLGVGSMLGIAPLAQAQTGAQDNISSIEAGIGPNAQSATKLGRVTLFAQVQTFDADQGPLTVVDKAAEQVYIDFDKDIVLFPEKYPTCNLNDAALSAANTSSVINQCGDAAIGSGAANALVPTGFPAPAPPSAQLEFTITALNGPTTTAGPVCQGPGDGVGGPPGCEFDGGNPSIILHAFTPSPATSIPVRGEIANSPAGPAFGKRLSVTDAPDTAGDAGSLILFNSTVGRTEVIKTRVGQRPNVRVKTKVNTYTGATCSDGTYDFAARWVYDDNTEDTDTFVQRCGTP